MRSRSVLPAVLLLALIACTATAQDAAWKAETATHIDDLRDVTLSAGKDRVILHTGDRRFRLSLPRGLFLLSPLKTSQEIIPASIIPQGRVASGDGAVAKAWLTGPTDRYRHGVLGDRIEATALQVAFANGREATYSLEDNSVFEDPEPRVVTVDGLEGVLVVHTYPHAGAALAFYGVAGSAIQPLAESRPIGQTNRWQNPVGAADFDGDGKTEIASVVTPHLSGTLTLFRQFGRILEPVASVSGYANHFIGSKVLGMSAMADVDGDGIADIIVPSLDRLRLVAISFAGGKAREVQSIAHDSPISTSIVMADIDGNGVPEIVYGLANGAVTVIRR
ncbi:MAG: VCBS repeat-containing protein [Proteobacteria bacterium]|nr:VCBS repeat-containing protein [Pseudomonadota bacterium]